MKKSGYHYTECGLRNVWLGNGFEWSETDYGRALSIHDIEGLHKAIGENIARKSRLTGSELRFLRKELDLSQRALAVLLGTTDQSIAKWEKNGRVPTTSDRLARALYLEHISGNIKLRETIEAIADTDRIEADRMYFEESSRGWAIAA